MTATSVTPAPARPIPTRRISFEPTLAELPRHFAGDGDLVMSHAIAVMSSLFPDGEDFFVRSVRHYRDQIDDPVLKRQVAGFIGQEAVHGREHRDLNDRFAELGYPTKRVERFTRRALELRERLMPPISNLATTAALEHFTATLAEVLLRDPEARRVVGAEAVNDVLAWHALEECEHKAVAFDVYRAVGGSERLRILTMKLVAFGFITTSVAHTIASLAADRETYRRGVLLRSLRRLPRSPFLARPVRERLRDYDRRGFHPDDHDTEELLVRWRDRLFGDDGRLVPLLSGAA